MTTTQKAIIGVTLAAAVGTGVYEAHQNSKLRAENQMLQQKQVPISQPQLSSAAKASTNVTPATFDWRMVESADYRKYIANLRAIGCPEETIRDIIIADVNKLFESRRQALNAGGKKYQYWKTGNPLANMIDANDLEQRRKLVQEKRDLFQELLGFAPEEKPEPLTGMPPYEGMLDFLPAEKQSKVTQIIQDWQIKQLKEFKDGLPDAEGRQAVREMEQAMAAEVATILSPQELEEFQLRMSPTASLLRMQLAGFDPTEQEFRDIFKVVKAYEDQFGPMASSKDKAERAQAEAAQKDVDAQIKSRLGDARYAEYKRAQDWTYKGIVKAVERNGLTSDAAVKVYDMKKLAEEAAIRVRTDRSLTTEQRNAALRGIRVETENSIRAVFGDQAFSSYLAHNGSYWLKNISPNP